MISDLVHGGSIKKATVDHRVDHRVGVTNILKRIPFQYGEVGKLARLDGADVVVEAEIGSSVQRACTKRLQRRHATLGKHPDFPVCGKPFSLTVGPELYGDSDIRQRLAALRDRNVVVLFLGGPRRASASERR